MSTLLVETLSSSAGPVARETATSAPAVETEAARLEQVGPYRQDNSAAAQTDVALSLGATDAAAPTELVAGRAGTIIGVVARSNADLTAGTATFRASKNGTGVGGSGCVLSDTVQQKISESAAVEFAAGDLLGVLITTNGAFAPVTADVQAYLLVRWAA
jgi:hypothetical protein